MKITIGSLIRKELANPDSKMSCAVRHFKAVSYLLKHNPHKYKLEMGSFEFYQKDKTGNWCRMSNNPNCYGYTIGNLLKLY